MGPSMFFGAAFFTTMLLTAMFLTAVFLSRAGLEMRTFAAPMRSGARR